MVADLSVRSLALRFESASQFSREYIRQFGASPVCDAREIHQAITDEAFQYDFKV